MKAKIKGTPFEVDVQLHYDSGQFMGFIDTETHSLLYNPEDLEFEENIKGLPKLRGWIARQPDGSLWLFSEKPYFNRCINEWGTAISEERELDDITDSTIFSDLTWESEPVEVELLIKKI